MHLLTSKGCQNVSSCQSARSRKQVLNVKMAVIDEVECSCCPQGSGAASYELDVCPAGFIHIVCSTGSVEGSTCPPSHGDYQKREKKLQGYSSTSAAGLAFATGVYVKRLNGAVRLYLYQNFADLVCR